NNFNIKEIISTNQISAKGTPLFITKPSQMQLSVDVSDYNDVLNYVYPVMFTYNRTVINKNLKCDGQVIFMGNSQYSDCQKYGCGEHVCYYSNVFYQRNFPSLVDYSCPPSKNNEGVKSSIYVTSSGAILKMTKSVDEIILMASSTINTPVGTFVLRSEKSNYVAIFTNTNKNVISINDTSTSFKITASGDCVVITQKLGITESSDTQIYIENNGMCDAFYFNKNKKCIQCKTGKLFGNTCYDLSSVSNCKKSNKNFGCEDCENGYGNSIYSCNSCGSNCNRCVSNTLQNSFTCIECENGYYLKNRECETYDNTNTKLFSLNYTILCHSGYYSTVTSCEKCIDNNCDVCVETGMRCVICNTKYYLENGKCIPYKEGTLYSQDFVTCEKGYYVNIIQNKETKCTKCSETYGENCETCNSKRCSKCTKGVLDSNGYCTLNSGCEIIENGMCVRCQTQLNTQYFNGAKCVLCDKSVNCTKCEFNKCVECSENSYLYDGECHSTINKNCEIISTTNNFCLSCPNGFYLNSQKTCMSCGNNCSVCSLESVSSTLSFKLDDASATQNDSTLVCKLCKGGYAFKENTSICLDSKEITKNCKNAIPGTSSSGCAVCMDGYYRDNVICKPCISNCEFCNTHSTCLKCASEYFLLTNSTKCIPYSENANCKKVLQYGCDRCNDGFFVDKQFCTSCDSITPFCVNCNTHSGQCTSCVSSYILSGQSCVLFSTIEHCKKEHNSKCSKCSFWYIPSEDGDHCDTHAVWWFILIWVLFVIIVVIIITLIICFSVKYIMQYMKLEEQRKKTAIFDMDKSNISFMKLGTSRVMVNKHQIELLGDDKIEIPVTEESRELICIGNGDKTAIKVQFSFKEKSDKYTIRTTPELFVIPSGKAAEFEIFVTPLCTCTVTDKLVLVSVNMKKGTPEMNEIPIRFQTVISSRLDYEEVAEEKKIGEGSFGVVYKGTYRKNIVAIKKMKNEGCTKQQIEEFEKEVNMLEKFRSDYIVHFYGAVFVPKRICLVTEFADFGSLQDLMNHKKSEEIEMNLRIKYMLDASKAIFYLHENGILHRDIKPDNILIFSFDLNVKANAKLTDFGSSRNVNLLLTNMTFTKGIGTPKYMAPETLNSMKYKRPADIYSFAITMYECFIWGVAYPKNEFKYSWNIVNFVASGKRRQKPDFVTDNQFEIITECWKQQPADRPPIEDVVEKLEKL
ncbi:protein kinase domain containing protein, partial [Entamoeba invadens IP1]